MQYSNRDTVAPDDETLFTNGFNVIFPTLEKGHTTWTDLELKRLRYYLIKLFPNVKNGKTGNDLMLSTMKQYVLGIQRALKQIWEFGRSNSQRINICVPK